MAEKQSLTNRMGYFIVNKTVAQFHQEKDISNAFSAAHVLVHDMENVETIFIESDVHMRSYLLHLIETAEIFKGKYLQQNF